jgi:hypothetical protein
LKDRFQNPAKSGYRDILLNIDLNGHYAEIRLELETLNQVAADEHVCTTSSERSTMKPVDGYRRRRSARSKTGSICKSECYTIRR